jgi:hypothetical protein
MNVAADRALDRGSGLGDASLSDACIGYQIKTCSSATAEVQLGTIGSMGEEKERVSRRANWKAGCYWIQGKQHGGVP